MKKIKIRLMNRTDLLTDMDGEIKKPALERVQPLDHRDSLRLTTSLTRNSRKKRIATQFLVTLRLRSERDRL